MHEEDLRIAKAHYNEACDVLERLQFAASDIANDIERRESPSTESLAYLLATIRRAIPLVNSVVVEDKEKIDAAATTGDTPAE